MRQLARDMNIGIFGGTFDPPHLGHLIAAQDCCTALSLDRLIFMPAANPPHKREAGVSAAAVRLEMLRATPIMTAAGSSAFMPSK